MIHDEYPVQRTNPARDLYNMWYALAQYHAPHLLTGEPVTRYAAMAFKFHNGFSLRVEDNVRTKHAKPALCIPTIMRIWPNGDFSPLAGAYGGRWFRGVLGTYEQLTFLRWGYVARGKAMWVQDTPRRGWQYSTNREYPDPTDHVKRVPYLPLTETNLFQTNAMYRLKQVDDRWVIKAANGWDNTDVNERSKERLELITRVAQDRLDERYGIAEQRYDWHARRAEAAKRREHRSTEAIIRQTVDRSAVIEAFIQQMIVHEPRIGPRGKAPQPMLPFNDKEAVPVGR